MTTRIVLAYSGGLASSAAIRWLAEAYGAEIVTVTMDIGQGREIDDVRERALRIGAARAHVLDVGEEFARDFVQPALQAGAIDERRGAIAAALSRPLIAKRLLEIARFEAADAVAHGCGADGGDLARLEAALGTIAPDVRIISPAREWGLSRAGLVGYAGARGIPVPARVSSPCSVDTNLWGRTISCGQVEDPWQEPSEDLYSLTKSPAEAPDRPAYVEIDFERGVPVATNGVAMSLVELIQSLETIAGVHGVGRVDNIECRAVGLASRAIHEAPAAVALNIAHRDLQRFVTPSDLDGVTSALAATYADLVADGLWFSLTREAIDALVAKVQERVTGTVRLKLFKGDCRVVGRTSPHAPDDRSTQVGKASGTSAVT